MDKKEFRPENIVRSKVNYSGMGLELQEGEVFELPRVDDTIQDWQESHRMYLKDCEPVKADLFSLKKLRFEQKEVVSWKGNGQDHQPKTSGTSQIDFVYDGRFTVRFEERHYTDKEGKLQFENSVHLIYGEWYAKIAETIPMENEIEFIHEVQNWYYLFTGEEITIKGD